VQNITKSKLSITLTFAATVGLDHFLTFPKVNGNLDLRAKPVEVAKNGAPPTDAIPGWMKPASCLGQCSHIEDLDWGSRDGSLGRVEKGAAPCLFFAIDTWEPKQRQHLGDNMDAKQYSTSNHQLVIVEDAPANVNTPVHADEIQRQMTITL
jgi:hypothetical protein